MRLRAWSVGVVLVLACSLTRHASAGQRSTVARDVPSSITVISAQDIERLPVCVRSFESLLRQVPGTPALEIEHVDVPPAPPNSGPLTWTWGGATRRIDEPFCVDDRDLFRQPITYGRGTDTIGTLQLHPNPSAPKTTAVANAGAQLIGSE